MPKDNPHVNHRKRIKKRFLNEDLDHFEDYQALELLLFYSLSQIDTVPIARALLAKFGSISGVFEADFEELLTVEGVGEHTAILLSMIAPMFRKYQLDKVDEKRILDTTEKLGEYVSALFIGKSVEEVYMLCLTQKNRLICTELLTEGDTASVTISSQKALAIALRSKAYYVVLAHNHPQHWAIPSHVDCRTTEELMHEFKTVGIHLKDHIIVASDGYYSMEEHGLLEGASYSFKRY